MPIVREPIGIDDYRHYYEGCLGLSEGKVVYVNEIQATGGGHRYNILGTTVIDGMWHPITLVSDNITYPTPELGYINVFDIAVHMKRLPLRQWKRGLCKSVLKIDFPEVVIGELAFFPNEFRAINAGHSVVVEALFKRHYPTYDEAIRQIIRGEAACRALSPNILLTSTCSDKLGVYYDNSLVGMVDGRKLVLSESSRMFHQELEGISNNLQIGYV